MKHKKDLVLSVRDLKDLVVAPPQDPFSTYEPERNGESALARVVRHSEIQKEDISRFIVKLPKAIYEKVNITEARRIIRDYLERQLEENTDQRLILKARMLLFFRNSFLFFLLSMILITIFSRESFLPNLPPLLRQTFIESLTVIGWVVLWRPVDVLLSEYVPLQRTKKMFNKLLKAGIEIKSQ